MKLINIIELFYKEYFDKLNTCYHYKDDVLNQYHIENTVWTHTFMVLNYYIKKHNIDLNDDINEINLYHKINFLALLLHDIGKPFTRKKHPKNPNRVIFSQHENFSTILALDFLKKIGIEKENIVYISWLINYHGIFMNYSIKKIERLFKFNKVLLENIISFSKFDRMGSLSLDNKIKDYYLEFDFDNFINESKIKYNKKDKEIVILIGLPGSGKSTFYNKYFKDKNYKLISRDELLIEYGREKYNTNNYNEIWKKLSQEEHRMIDGLLIKKFTEYKKKNENIVIDLTNVSMKTRKKWFSGKKYFYRMFVFLKTINECIENNKKRKNDDKDLDLNVIYKFAKKFQMPLYNEFLNDEPIEINYLV